MKTRFPILLLSLLIFACSGGDATNESNETTNQEQEAANNDKEVKAGNSCCFTDEEMLKAFFPASTEEFETNGKVYSHLFCLDDPSSTSKASATYRSGGEKYKLMISDYCAKSLSDFAPFADPNTNAKTKEGPGAFEELQSSLYKGFVKHYEEDKSINNGNAVDLSVIVDDRFLIKISAINQTGIEKAKALFEQIPVDKLAALGK